MNAPLDEIVQAIGLPLALKLVARFGGTRIPLPLAANLAADNPVAQAIGLEPTRALCVLWGGERPSVPRAAAWLRAERDRQLREDSLSLSVPQLARKYTMTERQVYNCLGDDGDDPAQQQRSLFG